MKIFNQAVGIHLLQISFLPCIESGSGSYNRHSSDLKEHRKSSKTNKSLGIHNSTTPSVFTGTPLREADGYDHWRAEKPITSISKHVNYEPEAHSESTYNKTRSDRPRSGSDTSSLNSVQSPKDVMDTFWNKKSNAKANPDMFRTSSNSSFGFEGGPEDDDEEFKVFDGNDKGVSVVKFMLLNARDGFNGQWSREPEVSKMFAERVKENKRLDHILEKSVEDTSTSENFRKHRITESDSKYNSERSHKEFRDNEKLGPFFGPFARRLGLGQQMDKTKDHFSECDSQYQRRPEWCHLGIATPRGKRIPDTIFTFGLFFTMFISIAIVISLLYIVW